MCSQFCLPIAVFLCTVQICEVSSAAEPQEPRDLAEWQDCIARSGPLYEAGRFGDATRVLETAVHYAEHFPALDPRLPTTIHALGFLYQEQGKYAEATNLYLRAILLWERLGPGHRDALLQSMDNLIGTYMEDHHYRAARALMELRLPMERSATKWEDRATFLNMRASLAEAEHHYGQAERLYRESLELWEKHGTGDDKNTAIVLMNLSSVFLATKRYQDALDVAVRALRTLEILDPTASPLVERALEHTA
jgi:tetratricopeptide (TPR) repeat protein